MGATVPAADERATADAALRAARLTAGGQKMVMPGEHGNLHTMFGKISAVLTLLIVLVLGPVGMIQLNNAWDWPRLQIPGGRVIGSGLMVGTVAVWLYCSRLFARIGKGTPFVTEPPRQLVTAGLYRYSRNPIYVAHGAFLLGWFLRSGRLTVLLYTGAIIALIHATIVWWEEPGLRTTCATHNAFRGGSSSGPAAVCDAVRFDRSSAL